MNRKLVLSALFVAMMFMSVVSLAADEKKDIEKVPFDTYEGYFVSNKFEPDSPESFVVIKNQKELDKVLGTAMVMGDRSHRLPARPLEKLMVLVAVKRGQAVWTYKVESVSLKAGKLTVDYKATSKEENAKFASPLIVSVPKGKYKQVEFVENGKPVKTIELKSKKEDKEQDSETGEEKQSS